MTSKTNLGYNHGYTNVFKNDIWTKIQNFQFNKAMEQQQNNWDYIILDLILKDFFLSNFSLTDTAISENILAKFTNIGF